MKRTVDKTLYIVCLGRYSQLREKRFQKLKNRNICGMWLEDDIKGGLSMIYSLLISNILPIFVSSIEMIDMLVYMIYL